MLLKILTCALYTSPLSVQALQSRSPILCILCYNSSLVTWTVVSLTTAEFKSPIFSMSGFALSYTTNMILYDFCLSPSQFCYLMVCIRKVESNVQIADRCAPWNFFPNILFKNAIRTSQETHYICTIETNRLILLREKIGVCCENYTKHADHCGA
jgi:hypothetical protein